MKTRILIADDEAWVRLIVRDSLQKAGRDYEIVTAADGLEALDWIEGRRFDLVITDLRMPGLNGVELTRAVREIWPDTRVIWMTAHGCWKTATEGAQLDIYSCLDKPIEIAEVRRAVRDALEGISGRPRRVLLPEQDADLAYAE